MTMMRDQDLDDLFAAARAAHATAPSPGLLARVLADAYDAQPDAAPAAAAPPVRQPGFLARLGGFPALSGLAAAAIGGLWVGFAAPSAVAGVSVSLGFAVAEDTVELIPDFPQFLTEGS